MTVTPHNTPSMHAFLTAAGWVISPTRSDSFSDAVKDFQAAYNLGPALEVDGVPGPLTAAAANESARLGYKVSANFTAREFQCGCGGHIAGCRSIRVTRALLQGLEKLRAAHYRAGLAIVSGYRCPTFNAKVGGISTSFHRDGKACDVPRAVTADQVLPGWGFTGIGVTSRDKLIPSIGRRRVVHLDVGCPRRTVFQE